MSNPSPSLSELAIYPVKSCAQVPLKQSTIGPFGLHMDRRWMLVDEHGVMLTQRKHARMCLIHCEIQEQSLSLHAPGLPSIMQIQANIGSPVQARVWEDTCRAYDCGDEAAAWLSEFLQTPARLAYFAQDTIRQVDLTYAQPGDITAFSDGFPYLLISQASLDDLNQRLTQAVEMQRFRPNLVISGTEAFAEDQWKRIRIGDIEFSLVKPCSRCIIPSINPQTAEKSPEPVKTLAGYRSRNNKIYFGQNVIANGEGILEVGMPVEILE